MYRKGIYAIIVFVLCFSITVYAARLVWDANTEPDIAGYKVYRGESSRIYGTSVDVGNTTEHQITGLVSGTTYYFAVKAYNIGGAESEFSSEVSYVEGLQTIAAATNLQIGWHEATSMTITYVQSAGPIDFENTIDLTGVTAGNLIVLFAKWEGTNPKFDISATDGMTALTIGTRAESASSDGVCSQFAYLLSANAGNKTYTVTFPAGGQTGWGLIVFEFSYTGTPLLDVQNIGNGNSNAALTGNITTTGTDEVVLGGTGGWSNIQYPTSSEQLNDEAATAVIRGGVNVNWPPYTAWYKIFAATISNAHAQCAFAASEEWAANIISFKSVAGGIKIPVAMHHYQQAGGL